MVSADSAQFILEAAGELFTREGFERTSLQTVADRAGVAKGLIGHHFHSKHGLLTAVLVGFYQRQQRALQAAYDPELSLPERVKAVVDAYFDFMCGSHLYPRLIQHIAGRDDQVRAIAQQQLRGLHTWVESVVLADVPDQGPAAARQFTVTIAGAVLTYFSFAPALGPMWPDADGLLSDAALAQRRAHLHLLVDAFLRDLALP